MKILAIISNNAENGQDSYGYDIWRTMKDQFHIYLDDGDIGNVYHHLNDLCTLNYVTRGDEVDGKCLYRITEEGASLKAKYEQYIGIMKSD